MTTSKFHKKIDQQDQSDHNSKKKKAKENKNQSKIRSIEMLTPKSNFLIPLKPLEEDEYKRNKFRISDRQISIKKKNKKFNEDIELKSNKKSSKVRRKLTSPIPSPQSHTNKKSSFSQFRIDSHKHLEDNHNSENFLKEKKNQGEKNDYLQNQKPISSKRYVNQTSLNRLST